MTAHEPLDPYRYVWPSNDPARRAAEAAAGPIRKGYDIETSWPHARIDTKAAVEDDPEADAINDMMAAFEEFKERQEDRMERLEVAFRRAPGPGPSSVSTKSQEERAFDGWVRRGDAGVTDAERKSLVASNDVSGGYLAQPGLVNELLRNLVVMNPLRDVARVMTISSGAALLPKRTGAPTAAWVGEVETRPATQPSYGQARITPWEAACHIDVSQQLLEDAAFSLEQELGFDLAEEFARIEGQAFLLGDGVNKPTGLLTDSAITDVPTGHATQVTADGLITALYSLPQSYRSQAVWLMNSSTLATVRKLKDQNDQYLWASGLATGQPEGLLGLRVVEMPSMPDIAAGAYPIALGDFRQGYRIVDRVGLTILRDPYTLATTGQVRFHARRRVGGDVIRPEAIRKVKVGTV